MQNERLAVPHRKYLQQCIQIGVLQLVITWQQLQQRFHHDIENRKETDMQEMTNFTHPIELSNEELDLVAAGWSNSCGCGGKGGGNEQVGFINVNNVDILSHDNVNVNVLGIASQFAG
jgi:hypothetical protein